MSPSSNSSLRARPVLSALLIAFVCGNIAGFCYLYFSDRIAGYYGWYSYTSNTHLDIRGGVPYQWFGLLALLIIICVISWLVYCNITQVLLRLRQSARLILTGVIVSLWVASLPFQLLFVLFAPPFPTYEVFTLFGQYRISAIQYWTTYESNWLDVRVIRDDGLEYRQTVDFSTNDTCSSLTVKNEDRSIQFLCEGNSGLGAKISVDLETSTLIVRGGSAKVEQPLSELEYTEPTP